MKIKYEYELILLTPKLRIFINEHLSLNLKRFVKALVNFAFYLKITLMFALVAFLVELLLYKC